MSLLRCPAFRARLLPSLTGLCTLALGAMDVLQPDLPRLTDRPEVQAFVQAMAAEHAFEATALGSLLDGIQPNAEAIELVKPPPATGRRNWRVYRSRFVEPQRIRAGVAFWK